MTAKKYVKTGPENFGDPKFEICVLNNLYIDYNINEFENCLKTHFAGKAELPAEKWVKTCPENYGDPKFEIFVIKNLYIDYNIIEFEN